jgi:hypothetical protein
MIKIRFDTLYGDTFGWIQTMRLYIEEMEHAINEVGKREIIVARELISKLGWSEKEYDFKRQDIEADVKYWLPMALSYSVIPILCMIVEAHLDKLSEKMATIHKKEIVLKDIAGKGIIRSKTYLEKVININISEDSAWEDIICLQEIRNIIVHGRGIVSPDNKKIENLMRKYPGDISLDDPSRRKESEIILKYPICKKFVEIIEGFFQRVYRKALVGSPSLREH